MEAKRNQLKNLCLFTPLERRVQNHLPISQFHGGSRRASEQGGSDHLDNLQTLARKSGGNFNETYA